MVIVTVLDVLDDGNLSPLRVTAFTITGSQNVNLACGVADALICFRFYRVLPAKPV
jgi:hypothetical protein